MTFYDTQGYKLIFSAPSADSLYDFFGVHFFYFSDFVVGRAKNPAADGMVGQLGAR